MILKFLIQLTEASAVFVSYPISTEIFLSWRNGYKSPHQQSILV